jgi:hypothetical protein
MTRNDLAEMERRKARRERKNKWQAAKRQLNTKSIEARRATIERKSYVYAAEAMRQWALNQKSWLTSAGEYDSMVLTNRAFASLNKGTQSIEIGESR